LEKGEKLLTLGGGRKVGWRGGGPLLRSFAGFLSRACFFEEGWWGKVRNEGRRLEKPKNEKR